VLLGAGLRDAGATVAIVGLFGGLGAQGVRGLCERHRLACLRVSMPRLIGDLPTRGAVKQFARDLAALSPEVVLPLTAVPNVLCSLTWRRAGAKACIWNQRDEGVELPDGFWQREAIARASGFVSNSVGGARVLGERFGVPAERVRIVPNAVVLERPRQTGAEWHAALGAGERTIGVMVGNLQKNKDHATLVAAWWRVVDAMPMGAAPPLLVLAGRRGDTAAEIETQIAALGLGDHVRVIGETEDISGLLAAADFAVFASHAEGMPNGVLEPMAAGLPIVASDVAGVRAALGAAAGLNWLSPPTNAAALAAAVGNILLDETGRRAAGEANRAVAAGFSIGASVAAMRAAISDAFSEPRRK
jgi:glycosyltransferase involved in cell wall biosynthesis